MNFINPRIVEVVPRGSAGAENRRLDTLPHLSVSPPLDGCDRVERGTVSESLEKELHGRAHDTARRGQEGIARLAPDEDGESKQEQDGGKQEGEPETDITLGVGHGELTDQGTDVDKHVEVVVDAGQGDSGIDDDTLSVDGGDAHPVLGDLLGNEGGNVGLETSGSETHDDQSDHEAAQGAVGIVHDLGDGGNGQDDVAEHSNADGVEDGLETTEVGIGDVGSEQRQDIGPEGVEGGDVEGNLLAETETTGLGFVAAWVEGSTGGSWPLLGDEVGDESRDTIPGHALDEFDEGNGVDLPVETGGDTLEGPQLFLGGDIVSRVVAEIAVLQSGLALGRKERWRGDEVSFRVLALGVARGIDTSRVNAHGYLNGIVGGHGEGALDLQSQLPIRTRYIKVVEKVLAA